MEATGNYHWLVDRIEPLPRRSSWPSEEAEGNRRIPKKTDRLDAQILAEFLARDIIPEAYMPTPRQRQHRFWSPSTVPESA